MRLVYVLRISGNIMSDRFIIALLVASLLFLSGCVGQEAIPSDEVESPNQQPIIYGGFGVCNRECYFEGDWYHSLVTSNELYTVDPDGNITDFGMDWDNDFEIDWNFPWNWSSPNSTVLSDFNYSMIEIHEPENLNDPDAYCTTDYMNLISIDDDGGKQISPIKWTFKWDEDEQHCLVGIST